MCFLFAKEFGIDPAIPAGWPYHKFMAVQYTYQIRQLKELRAARRARARSRGDDDMTVQEWGQSSFDRPE